MSLFNHHAYLISGERASRVEKLRARFVAEGILLHNNPDIFEIHTDMLSIDEARALSTRQLRHAVTGSKKIFIISFANMSHEAQNALLKVFEEPTPDTHFFLLTESPHALLPTLRSRLENLILEGEGEADDLQEAEAFIAMTPSERLLFVAPLIEEKEKDKALVLINGLETLLHKNFSTTKREDVRLFLKDLEHYRGYLSDRSSSLKLILEFVACMCPSLGVV